MSSNLHPPQLPLRKADSSSKFLSKDLAIAYPMLDRGDTLVNYGYLGSIADLNLINTSYSRSDGLNTLRLNSSSVAERNGVNLQIPSSWSYAYWVKLDSAPSGQDLDIFTLQGPTESHLRAWADAQGIWSWQKHTTADAYSILPAADFPTSRLMLVVSVFTVSYIPPAQLRTNQGFSNPPEQPFSYTAFNDGQGAQATQINSILLGNNNSDSAPLNGELGPLYFWSRVISESEIWQLWKDPYAPFRRATEQVVVPSALQSNADFSLEGIGKSTDLQPLFQDDNALVIYMQDYIDYARLPIDDVIEPESSFINNISINSSDTVAYVGLPTDDAVDADSYTISNLIITANDTYSYVDIPIDSNEADAPFSLLTVNVADSFNYVDLPADQFIPADSSTISNTTISVSDTFSYQTEPTEMVTGV